VVSSWIHGYCLKGLEEDGIVVVYYDAQPGSGQVPVKAFKADSAKVGPAIISLRHGDDDYDNLMTHTAME
jgi:hypothetical protein